MQCTECTEELNLSGVTIRTGCRSTGKAFPCKKCGRLHFLGGDGVPFGLYNRSGDRAFWIEDKVINKPPLVIDKPPLSK